jgi:CRISPR/Cas system CSM-associated protein Csm3 (group 7 of RAMP superfamily)
MTKFTIKLDISSWWMAGSGDGDGPEADQVIATIGGGLPYLPGKTLKGLLRDACETWVACTDQAQTEYLEELFGTSLYSQTATAARNQAVLDEARFESTAGCIVVGNALPAPPQEHVVWVDWSRTETGSRKCRHMIQLVASTRINELGVAADQSLRTVQVAIPMELQARIEMNLMTADTAPYEAVLRGGASILRQLGSSRHRGFGRVKATIHPHRDEAA